MSCCLLPNHQTEVKMVPFFPLFIFLVSVLAISVSEAFHIVVPTSERYYRSGAVSSPLRHQFSCSGLQLSSSDDEIVAESEITKEQPAPKTEEEKAEAVGNLVANDEWEGLTMELSELIRTAVIEDIKSNAREFLGKDEYKVGDISKAVDSRVKAEVARLRGKEDYEIGDFVVVMDTMAKDMTSDLTGKPYETGDLSKELDKRVKNAVAKFCGKEEGKYEFGDLSKEIDRRIKTKAAEYLGKEYEFGDITREIEKKRKAWVKDYLGDEVAANYKFGDITKKALTGLTGKDSYEFGDVTKKLMGNIFKKNS